MRFRCGLALLAVVMSIVPVGGAVLGASEASAADDDQPPAIEDFAYPGAAEILAERGIELKTGDGNFVLADCPAAPPGGVVWVSSYEAGPDLDFCFRVDGPVGYLALEIPRTYWIRGDGVHDVTATVSVDDQTSSVAIPRDAGAPVGASSPDKATLLELVATKGAHPGDGLLPANSEFPYVGRVNIGAAGRPGSRSCTGSLVAPQWVLSAASCFAEDPVNPVVSPGAPATPTTVTFPGRQPLDVATLLPHDQRDVVLLQLSTVVEGIPRTNVGTAAPGTGASVNLAGFGRTDTSWGRDTVHASQATVESAGGSELALDVESGAVCKGDAGAPMLADGAGEGTVSAVVTRAHPAGCLDGTGATTGATAVRVDDLAGWIGEQTATCGDRKLATPVVGNFVGDAAADVVEYRPGADADLLLTEISTGNTAASTVCDRYPVSISWTYEPLVGDFDADGYDEIFWYAVGAVADYLWDFNDGQPSGRTSIPMTVNGTYRPVVGDFTGDTADDIFWYGPGDVADPLWDFQPGAAFSFDQTVMSASENFRPIAGRFSTDGVDDVVWYGRGADRDRFWNFEPSSAAPSYTSHDFGPISGDDYRPLTVDRGGDGLDDILWYRAGGTTPDDPYWEYTPNGWVKSVVDIRGSYRVGAGDLLGDGHEDVLFYAVDNAHAWDHYDDGQATARQDRWL